MADSAFVAALKVLGRRDYFRSELAEKLSRAGFNSSETEAALVRCAELGYLDDPRLARRFVELRSVNRGWGPRRLEMELRSRGVEDGVAAEASRLTPEMAVAAMATAVSRAERRARRTWWHSGEGRARMVSSLVRRGFSVDEARAAADRLAAVRKADNDARDDQPGDPGDLS